MKGAVIFQSAVGFILALSIAVQAWSLYNRRPPQIAPVMKTDGKTCEPRSISGITNDGQLICDFENTITLQPWPRLCGCPEFCESPCQ